MSQLLLDEGHSGAKLQAHLGHTSQERACEMNPSNNACSACSSFKKVVASASAKHLPPGPWMVSASPAHSATSLKPYTAAWINGSTHDAKLGLCPLGSSALDVSREGMAAELVACCQTLAPAATRLRAPAAECPCVPEHTLDDTADFSDGKEFGVTRNPDHPSGHLMCMS